MKRSSVHLSHLSEAELIFDSMKAGLLIGHCGIDKLDHCDDVATPQSGAGKVLYRVAVVGVNNSEIDLHTGGVNGLATGDDNNTRCSCGPPTFPCIQRADVCGHVGAFGDGIRLRNLTAAHCDLPPDARSLGVTINRNLLGDPVAYREA